MSRRIDTQANNTAIRLTNQGAAPSSPGAGYGLLFAKADGVYFESQSGTVIGPFVTGSAGSGRVLIATVSPTGVGTVSFTSIPATYSKLIIEWVAKGTNNTDAVSMKIELNNDTTATNYRNIRLDTYAAGTGGDGGADDNVLDDAVIGSATGHTNEASHGIVEIPFYAVAFNKNVLSRWTQRRDTSSVQGQIDVRGINWENNATINRVDFILSAGNFASGSQFNLYGEN